MMSALVGLVLIGLFILVGLVLIGLLINVVTNSVDIESDGEVQFPSTTRHRVLCQNSALLK